MFSQEVDTRKPERHMGKHIKFDDDAAAKRGRATTGSGRALALRQLKGVTKWRGGFPTLQYAKEPNGVILRSGRNRHDRRYEASSSYAKALRRAEREEQEYD